MLPFSGTNSYNYDLSKMSELRKLYNSKVYLCDRMTRPLSGMSIQIGKLSHSGVRYIRTLTLCYHNDSWENLFQI